MDNKRIDEDLWKGIKEGNETAFRGLFDKYYRSMSYAAYKVYPDEHKAKDFAQEVFLTLWKKRETIIIHTSLHAFLRRAVVNKAIDYIRSQRLNFEETPDFRVDKYEASKEMEHKELKTLIHQTVERLPERCRMVFALSRFEELSHKEIASRLDISEKTVENQITKALKLLRKTVGIYFSELKLILLTLSFFS